MKNKYSKYKSEKVKWEDNRIAGCQSINHVTCRGEHWECRRCHKVICWEEGSADDLVDLCDDCWYGIRVLGYEYLTLLDARKGKHE
jgi:hypothetical protein